MSDLTIIVSGPLATRGTLLTALERVGANLSEDQPVDPGWHQFPESDPTVSWVRCRHTDLEQVVAAVAEPGWALRAHRHTPTCKQCGGVGTLSGRNSPVATCLLCEGQGVTNRQPKSREQVLEEQMETLNARLAALEARQ